jgi:hypothetical protein
MTSPAEARGKLVVKLPSSNDTTISNKFSLAGTDLDPVLLPRYLFDKVLSEKPRGGLSSSRWASLKTKATAPIIIEAPVTVPTLADAIKPASGLLFGTSPSAKPASAQQPVSLAPANAPRGPRAGVSSSRLVNLESGHQLARIQKTLSTQSTQAAKAMENGTASLAKPIPTDSKFMPRKHYSRYSSLGLDAACPRSSLKNFYTAVDLYTAALKKPDAAVQDASLLDVSVPKCGLPNTSHTRRHPPMSATPKPTKQVLTPAEAGADLGAVALKLDAESLFGVEGEFTSSVRIEV